MRVKLLSVSAMISLAFACMPKDGSQTLARNYSQAFLEKDASSLKRYVNKSTEIQKPEIVSHLKGFKVYRICPHSTNDSGTSKTYRVLVAEAPSNPAHSIEVKLQKTGKTWKVEEAKLSGNGEDAHYLYRYSCDLLLESDIKSVPNFGNLSKTPSALNARQNKGGNTSGEGQIGAC